MSLSAGLSASDAFMPALLYAMRVDAKSVRQLVDAFATHVSCNLGSTLYEEVNAVLCHHDLRACDAPPPVLCAQCGNGVREGAEACDGNDLGGATCDGLGFDGGVLACDASCMFDPSECDAEDPGLDVTGATDPADSGTDVTGVGTTLDDATGGGAQGDGGNDGCRCSAGSGGGASLAWVGVGLFGLLGALRRRGRTATAALVTVLGASNAQGCCDPAVVTGTPSEGESSTTGDDGSTESTGNPGFPEWAIGNFSSETDKVGMTIEHSFWQLWGKIEIDADGAMTFDVINCDEPQIHQEFRWTAVDGGRSLSLESVPPSDVFTFGNGHQVSELVVEPGDSCDTIVIRYLNVDPMQWVVSEYQRGNVCARPTGAEGCAFTFEWCDGEPPAPCE